MRSLMTTQLNLSPRVHQLSLVFLMFVLSSPVAAEEVAAPTGKPDAPAFTVGPAVPLTAEQRAALATKRAATLTGTPTRLTAIVPTKAAPFSFTSGPVGEATLKAVTSSEPTAAPEADAVETLVRVQGREAGANAGLLKMVSGHDELAKAAPRAPERRSVTSAPVRTARPRGVR